MSLICNWHTFVNVLHQLAQTDSLARSKACSLKWVKCHKTVIKDLKSRYNVFTVTLWSRNRLRYIEVVYITGRFIEA